MDITNENESSQIATNSALVRLQSTQPNPAAVYLARLAPGSRRTMRGALDTIAGILTSGRQDAAALDWATLRYQHTQAIRAALADRYQPAMANKCLAALRGTLKECWRLGLVPAEEYQRAADLAPVKGETLLRGRALSVHELHALFLACAADLSAGGRRDAALLAILYSAGLRRAEAAALTLADLDGTGAITVRSGKGNKARVAYVTGRASGAIIAWLDARGDWPGPLLCAVHWRGAVQPRAMTPQAIYDALRRRAKAAGVRSFSPHDLRRSMISDLLDAGADLPTVQKLAGHANVATTARYDRRGEAAKRRAADLLSVPF